MATNMNQRKFTVRVARRRWWSTATLGILYFTEHRVKAGGASFEKSLENLKEKEKQKSSRFQQAMEEEKQRKALLGKKFQELRKQADSNPDDRPPLRPFDLD
jgi:hypothetical protein